MSMKILTLSLILSVASSAPSYWDHNSNLEKDAETMGKPLKNVQRPLSDRGRYIQQQFGHTVMTQDFVSTTAVCSAAIISGCSQGTAVDAYGVRQVQAAVITDWNCDNVASGCTCHTNNANGRGCNSTDVGYYLRIRWGDGYTWSNTTARPQNYVLTHQYAASGTYTLQIAIFKVNSGYGVGYYPKVVVP